MRALAEYKLDILIKTPNSLASKREHARAIANLPGILKAVEEDLGGLLPSGWTVRIYQEGETP
jgi:hypothetical protein